MGDAILRHKSHEQWRRCFLWQTVLRSRKARCYEQFLNKRRGQFRILH